MVIDSGAPVAGVLVGATDRAVRFRDAQPLHVPAVFLTLALKIWVVPEAAVNVLDVNTPPAWIAPVPNCHSMWLAFVIVMDTVTEVRVDGTF